MAWTPESESRLTELVSDGLSFKMIGQLMEITKNKALGKAHRMGLTSFVPKPKKEGARKRICHTPEKGCRFIAGEPDWQKRRERIYCNAPRKPGSSYCPDCHAKVWVSVPPRKEREAA